MGFFSWETSDTGRSISNVFSSKGVFPVYLLLPEGGYIKETAYEGYGRFGGQDAYTLVGRWNQPELCKYEDDEDRDIGINIACYDEQNAALKYPLKFVEDKTLRYEDVSPSKNCLAQGYFYDE